MHFFIFEVDGRGVFLETCTVNYSGNAVTLACSRIPELKLLGWAWVAEANQRPPAMMKESSRNTSESRCSRLKRTNWASYFTGVLKDSLNGEEELKGYLKSLDTSTRGGRPDFCFATSAPNVAYFTR
ncbi:unnamed protein product [Phytophthora lilii]|uniref:Unnamed protein product n=1 Tax=Phytophthora lilii TaxID=2077276 RepID=A0A9W6WU62_9STRA|nr:unnamed protein product [Phytophthora lilii]